MLLQPEYSNYSKATRPQFPQLQRYFNLHSNYNNQTVDLKNLLHFKRTTAIIYSNYLLILDYLLLLISTMLLQPEGDGSYCNNSN